MVALCSLWLPIFLIFVELLGHGGLQALEYLFVALAWPAAVPFTVSVALFYRQVPFLAGVAAVCLSGMIASEFLWTGILGVALGTDYWQSGSPSFTDIFMGVVRVVGTVVVPSLPVYLIVGLLIWLRHKGWIR